MIVVETGNPFKQKTPFFHFWKNVINKKTTWAIIFIFIKISYIPMDLYAYTKHIEDGKTEWTEKNR